ncbi:MAG: DUF1648 domain-containing protein [Planctomycetota bacterium]|nr:DUF1648 domain-containing protein [Planctomycetota bacterium]
MNSQRIAMFAVAVIALLAVAQNAWYWGQLPDRVATHFNSEGTPNDWMTKTNATLTMSAFQIGMPFILIAVTLLAARLPASMVNIPHREYLLHPDRHASSMGYFQLFMNWIAVALSLFAMAINHLVFLANRDGVGLNTVWFGVLMAVFLVTVFLLVAKLLYHFRMPGESTPSR